MGESASRRHGIIRAATAIGLAGLVAACASGAPNPAPVILNGAGPGITGHAAGAPLPERSAAPSRPPEGQRIVVRPGQSLGGIAHAYRIPERAIIEANRLPAPYKLEAGQRLLIPGAAPPPVRQAVLSTPPPEPIAAQHLGHSPDIIPLDGPAPTAASPVHRAAAAPSPPAPDAARRPPAEPNAADETRNDAAAPAEPPAHGGHFAWPVHGHVLAGYGVATGGAHNDGINIAAPRGTPVKAIDGGTVAYTGNELRGYGNLVLIKHESGWISAYAHCEDVLVKRGDKVRPGQVIAKVGATGGVSEPQLHFELRRGKKAVDPREFLGPAPSADAAANRQG